MKEDIERNLLRIGRKVALVIVFTATIHLALAPYYYFRGIIFSGYSPLDFWIFRYTILNLTSLVWYSVAPILLLVGIYEVFRGIFILANGLILTIKRAFN
jgi:hypothetical protein